MKIIEERIAQRRDELARLPFFAFVEDDSLPPRERLAFAPYLAFFVMGFGDFNKYLLRDLDSNDPWQQVINEHTREDDHHWRWYLDDLRKLERARVLPFTDVLRFLWAEHTSKARQFLYRLCGLVHGADPRLRLAITQAVEGTGWVFFDGVAAAARSFTEETGMQLTYFGHFHMERETGHVMASGEALHAVEQLVLPEALRPAALEAVDLVFAAARAFIEEVWDNVQRDRRESENARRQAVAPA